MKELKQSNVQEANVQRRNARKEETEIDLLEIFQILMQKIWLIAFLFVLGATIAFGATKFLITPMYTASSQIYILTKTTSVTSLTDLQIGSQLTADFSVLAKSRPVVESVIRDLNLDYTYEGLAGMIHIQNPDDTRILKITVSNKDPKQAKEIANAFAEATAERVAYVMATDKPKVVEEAVEPKYPTSPDVRKNTLFGGMAGAAIAIGIIMLMYMMNDTIQTEEDVRKYLDLHTLAAIPMEKRR